MSAERHKLFVCCAAAGLLAIILLVIVLKNPNLLVFPAGYHTQGELDLDVDTDRDGVIDDADDMREESWTVSRGAIYIVNCDDDDKDDHCDAVDFTARGRPVDEDYEIDEGDIDDICPLVIQATKAIEGLRLYLRIAGKDAGNDARAIHIFKDIAVGEKKVFGGPSETRREIDVTTYVNRTEPTTFGLEGLYYRNAFRDTKFDGEIDLELVAKTPGGKELFKDRVRLRVAPWILLPNSQSALQIWAKDAGEVSADFLAALSESGCLESYKTEDDQWAQDHIQVGHSAHPRSQMHVVLQLPRKRHRQGAASQPGWARECLLGPDVGVYRLPYDLGGDDTGDFGGNIEGTPPTEAYKLGRIVLGNTCSRAIREFFDMQRVQSPFELDSSWLQGGHIDEFLTFDESGRATVADTELARKLLTQGVPAQNGVGTIQTVSGDRIGTGARAMGKLCLIPGAHIEDGETFTIGDGYTSLTFEFEKQGGTQGGNVAVKITNEATASDVRDAVVSAIARSPLKLTSYRIGDATAQLVHEEESDRGNVQAREGVADPGFLVQDVSQGKTGETFTISDGKTRRTFQFTRGGEAQDGNVGVRIWGGSTALDVRDATLNAINGCAGLNIRATKDPGTQVRLQNRKAGTCGNQLITETVSAPGFVVAGMAGGRDTIEPPPEHAVFFAKAGAVASGKAGGGMGTNLYDGPAFGSIRVVGGARIRDGEAFSLGDGGKSCVFEFEKEGGVGKRKVGVDIREANSPNKVRDAIVSAVNSSGLAVNAMGNVPNSVYLWNHQKGTSGNVAMRETVADPDFVVRGMANGKADGVDFTGGKWTYVRIYRGSGAGQTAQVKDEPPGGKVEGLHDGWIEIAKCWDTTSNIVAGDYDFYEYSRRYLSGAPSWPTWMRAVANDSHYVLVEEAQVYDPGLPAIVTVREVLADADLWRLNARAQEIIDKQRAELSANFGGSLTFVELPVVYFGRDPYIARDRKAAAFTPGAVNLKAASGSAFFPRQYGPRNARNQDVYEEYIRSQLQNGVSVPVWALHKRAGQVHCGVAAVREPFEFKWWQQLRSGR